LPGFALVMGIFPPIANVFVAVDPRFRPRPIGDGRANLRRAGLGRMIIPIIAFAALNIQAQIVEIIDRAPASIRMIVTITPIRQGHIIVDADEIDIGIGPKRIKMEIAIIAAIIG